MIVIAGIYLSGSMGKKLDNLCPKFLYFPIRQCANVPMRQCANNLLPYSPSLLKRMWGIGRDWQD
jgi:hypothetical protein